MNKQSQSYLGLRKYSQQYQSDKKSPYRTPPKAHQQHTNSEVKQSPLTKSIDSRKPLNLITNSPSKVELTQNQPFTFENRQQKAPTQMEQLIIVLKQTQESNEQLKEALEKQHNKTHEKEQEYLQSIEQLKQQQQKDLNLMADQQKLIEELELQLQYMQESESRMMPPINYSTNQLMQKVKEIEHQNRQYIQEMANLTTYLKDVLEQNKLIKSALDDANSELEQIKQKKRNPFCRKSFKS